MGFPSYAFEGLLAAASAGAEELRDGVNVAHKIRRAMLAGRVEVDQSHVGGLEEGRPGRLEGKGYPHDVTNLKHK